MSLYNDQINLHLPNSGYGQFYRFDIQAEGKWVGWIRVWLNYSIALHYSGQIGYMIHEDYRNRGYATQACLALRPFLERCGFRHVLITTDEQNAPSRRVCEKIGAALMETVDTPPWTSLHAQGQRRTCRYDWSVPAKEGGKSE